MMTYFLIILFIIVIAGSVAHIRECDDKDELRFRKDL